MQEFKASSAVPRAPHPTPRPQLALCMTPQRQLGGSPTGLGHLHQPRKPVLGMPPGRLIFCDINQTAFPGSSCYLAPIPQHRQLKSKKSNKQLLPSSSLGLSSGISLKECKSSKASFPYPLTS